MKTIKTTHIDTGGHGYFSVSKKDIELLGIADKISGYSGQNFNRVYLEEDQDGLLLYETAKKMDIILVTKSGYNLSFNIHHNYNPSLFKYQPKIGDKVEISSVTYTIIEMLKNKIIVTDANGKRFRIPSSNPFAFINKVLN